MALASREVPSAPYIKLGNVPLAPNLNGVAKDKIAFTATHNSMVGILTQLSVLASHSFEIFSRVSNEASQTLDRITKISKRIDVAAHNIAQGEKIVTSAKIQSLLSNPPYPFKIKIVETSQIFNAETAPITIKGPYNAAQAPPPLNKMDPYMEDGKRCIEHYTNPKFFLDEWIAEQIKQRDAAKEERKKRREKRKGSRVDEPKARTQLGTAQPTKLQKVVYDPVTGEKMASNDPRAAAILSRASVDVPMSRPDPSVSRPDPSISRPPPVANVPSPAVKPAVSTPAPPAKALPPVFSAPPPVIAKPPPAPVFDDAPPPPPDEFFSVPAPPAMDFSTPAPPPMDFAPPPPPTDYATPPPPVPRSTTVNAPAPPPLPPPAPEYAAPSGGGFLSAIQNTNLKPAAPAVPKVEDSRSTLLQGIKSGIALKSAQERKLGDAPAPAAPTSVAEILARRIAIQGSSDEEDEDDEDEEWG